MVTVFLLIFSILVSSCYGNNMTYNSTNNSTGSGSGFGMSCSDINCTGGGECIEGMGGPYCQCPPGKIIEAGTYNCTVCPIGTWGINCNRSCSDTCGGKGRIKSCDNENGTCICNDCWVLDNDTCSLPSTNTDGFQCFLDYLQSIFKSLEPYGGDIPVPADSKLRELAGHLINNDVIIQDDSAMLKVIERDDVGARDLARFSFMVRNQGTPDYDNSLNTIKEKIKNGQYRGTLIIDESDGSTAKVTVNV